MNRLHRVSLAVLATSAVMAALTAPAFAAPPVSPFASTTGLEQTEYVLGLTSALAPPDQDDAEEGGHGGEADESDHEADEDESGGESGGGWGGDESGGGWGGDESGGGWGGGESGGYGGDEFSGGYGGGEQDDADGPVYTEPSYGAPSYGDADGEESGSGESDEAESGDVESGDTQSGDMEHVGTLPATGSGSTTQPTSDSVYVSAPFQQYAEGVDAVTYSPELVPVGSQARVTSRKTAEGHTVVTLAVKGLQPNHDYGAHVHVNSCGKSASDAGAHYQHQKDPVQPSTDPAYANPDNEIWLDFTTDAKGAATVEVEAPWQFQDPRPKSVLIHSERTSTEAGGAGAAGDRLACVNVPF